MKRFAGLILIMFLSFLVSLKGLCIDVEKNYIREDGKADVRLGKPGYERIDEASDELFQMIQENGVLHLTDKSSPEDILRITGMSKKAFKQAVGKLYKARLIELQPNQIKLV